MRFTFDPKKERGSRIVRGSVQIRGHALQGSKVVIVTQTGRFYEDLHQKYRPDGNVGAIPPKCRTNMICHSSPSCRLCRLQ